MEGIKFFNFAIPIETYKKLKARSNRTGKPISEMLREAIEIVLKTRNGNPTTTKG
ncbi:MAG: ribbon-helix-helix domain-containing protein [Candidatus Brocadia sp. AMX2]|uniref:Predicted DNA-binding protein ribbon-helix-helix domain-containing protein n=1 Tax=Candidatus Brocadia sinica JPN1 TaxID=1197129 RepID=A0ABQ0JZ36_9BACT|nr:MAG: ribbon-helix-helix domain-containing protein [Candidatus Brocadia sp. AMX2]MBC6932210.1 ribbon-helix-helix domain-containing protein [Candidatus Brocadia sp.]MBL1168482.1 ribbon-helix-helix domain-containing protein [Candidatus Brocadia sp. AMX1]NOG40234.1 ribbon-helix-helix domain-containing protein [Planctomycetota bacterium]NUQ57688.1 ribbon-helix-helix domain-containing protein [Candidatus Paceibacter sp.]GAN33936.1 hypothetical protein BROSI_A2471 [Candidatus Brocadia sinica JPN1]